MYQLCAAKFLSHLKPSFSAEVSQRGQISSFICWGTFLNKENFLSKLCQTYKLTHSFRIGWKCRIVYCTPKIYITFKISDKSRGYIGNQSYLDNLESEKNVNTKYLRVDVRFWILPSGTKDRLWNFLYVSSWLRKARYRAKAFLQRI